MMRENTGANMNSSILAATSNTYVLEKIKRAASFFDAVVRVVGTGSEVITGLDSDGLFLVIVDQHLDDCDGFKLLSEIRKRNGFVSTILIGDNENSASMEVRKKALGAGANECLTGEWSSAELKTLISRSITRFRFLRSNRMIGRSRAIRDLIDSIVLVAPTNMTVLITGESGTGKELVARGIHDAGMHPDGPFIPINCGAIPEHLLESELFGHEKGAFTGAHDTVKGKFELAAGGTLFLDEIGELPLQLQVKLLRVFEDRKIMRVGGNREIAVQTRIVAATNRDLAKEVEAGKFRKDLYYRLKIVQINTPPLRERKEDIPLLVNFFVKKFEQENETAHPGFTKEAVDALGKYSWPGNVRELKSVVESALVFNPGNPVRPEALPDYIYSSPSGNRFLPSVVERSKDEIEREIIYKSLLALRDEIADVKRILKETIRVGRFPVNVKRDIPFSRDTEFDHYRKPLGGDELISSEIYSGENVSDASLSIEEMERELIEKALAANHGNRKKTAETLGIGERTLYRKIKKYGL